MMDLTNKIFKQHFGPVKLTGSMSSEIVADQERIDEERAGRRRADNGNERDWSGLSDRGKIKNDAEI